MPDKFPMRSVALKDGRAITLREANGGDARDLLLRVNRIAGESRNISMKPGEFRMTPTEERDYLERMRQNPGSLFIVAVDEGQIVGDLNFHSGAYARTKHQGLFGMSVDRTHWGLGIGAALIQALIEWAKAGGVIRKINLRVMSYNRRGIFLYRKFGFVEEGRHSRTFQIDGQFFDDISMGLEIDP